jgi:uncharacterized membrane protein
MTQSIFLLLFFYTLWVTASLFHSEKFAFHDLTLMSDILANTAFGRGFFYSSEFQGSWLRTHFTPSLLFWVPPYHWLMDSQLLFVWLGVFSFFLGVAFLMASAKIILEKLCPDKLSPLLLLICLSQFVLSPYSKNILTSAHYEVLYFPFFSFVVWSYLKGFSLVTLIPASLLALGVREDAGLTFGFQWAAMAFLPKEIFSDPKVYRRRAVALSLLGIIYLVVVLKAVLPALDAVNMAARYWARYGQTWGEVFLSILAHPHWAISDLLRSGFIFLNLSLFLLPWLSWKYALLANLPACLLYLSDATDKKMLWFYHSSFLLPGLFIGFALGLGLLQKKKLPKYLLHTFLFIPWIFSFYTSHGFQFRPYSLSVGKREAMAREIARDCKIQSLAADFYQMVFIPNRIVPSRYEYYRRADAVLVPNEPSLLFAGFSKTEILRAALFNDELYVHRPSAFGHIFVKRGVECQTLDYRP